MPTTKNVLKTALSLCFFVLGLQSNAKSVEPGVIESRIMISSTVLDVRGAFGERLNEQPVKFEFMLNSENELFLKAQFPESERFIEYGLSQLDRNKTVLIAKNVAALIEYEGFPYAVMATKAKDQQLDGRHKIIQLIPYTKSDSDPEKPRFGRDLSRNLISFGVSGSITGAAAASAALDGSIGFSILMAMIGLPAAALSAYCAWPENFMDMAQSEVSPKCRLNDFINTRKREFHGNALQVEKVDAQTPWTVENIRVKPRRGKAHLLTTMLKRARCETTLMGYN